MAMRATRKTAPPKRAVKGPSATASADAEQVSREAAVREDEGDMGACPVGIPVKSRGSKSARKPSAGKGKVGGARAAKRKTSPAVQIPTSAVECSHGPPPESGLALIERVSRAIERELIQIESVVGDGREPRTVAERRARTLASLAKTLAEVRRLRHEENKSNADADDGPRDLDEFRSELSRRLEQVVAARAKTPAGDDECGGA